MTFLKPQTNQIKYDYYQESWRFNNQIKPYIGFARHSGRKAVDDSGNRLLRLVSSGRELSNSQVGISAYDRIVNCLWDEIIDISAYDRIVNCLWDEIIPTDDRTPTHWLDTGYIQNKKIESILCLPVRLMIPGLSPKSAAIRIAGYLQAVSEQIPSPTWTNTQSISVKFCDRYTELMLKGLIAAWAHERGYMDKLRDTLRV